MQSQPVTFTIHSQVANHTFKILSGANSVLKVLFVLFVLVEGVYRFF